MTVIDSIGNVIPDPWVQIGDDTPLPADWPVILTLPRLQAEAVALAVRKAPTGLLLAPDQSPDLIGDTLHKLQLICLSFPKFTDGRAYSHARRLRDRFGWQGEIRAVGNVLRDQLLFMKRCGFDSFALPDGTNPDEWRKSLKDFSAAYQPASDSMPIAAELRSATTSLAAAGTAGSWSY